MAFAFQQEVATGKAASLCVCQATILVLLKQRLKKIFFAFQHSKIAKPFSYIAFQNPNRDLPTIIVPTADLVHFDSSQCHSWPPYFSSGPANSRE